MPSQSAVSSMCTVLPHMLLLLCVHTVIEPVAVRDLRRRDVEGGELCSVGRTPEEGAKTVLVMEHVALLAWQSKPSETTKP